MIISKQNTGYQNQCYVDWFWNKPHTELEIDGTLHNLFLGRCAPTILEEKQRIRANQGSGHPYVRFEVGLTSDEYKKLKESIKNKQIPISTCSGAIASLLNRIAKCEIPPLASLSTSGLAIHFLKDAKHPQSRISSIEIVDYNETKSLETQSEEITEDLDESEDEIAPPKTIDTTIAEGRYSDCRQVLQWMLTAAVLSVIFGSFLVIAGDTAAMLL